MTSRISWLLIAIAAPLLIAGMLSLNVRLCAIGAAVAILGIIIRIAQI